MITVMLMLQFVDAMATTMMDTVFVWNSPKVVVQMIVVLVVIVEAVPVEALEVVVVRIMVSS
jgi:hypothetical protein